jgi:hypothetical protein
MTQTPVTFHSSWLGVAGAQVANPRSGPWHSARRLFEAVINAHGGWNAWLAWRGLEFALQDFGGALMLLKGYRRTFTCPQRIVVDVKQRRVEFRYPGHSDRFDDGGVTFSAAQTSIQDGRELFRGTTFEQWRPEHAAYFFGYSWANYLSYPFSLASFEYVAHTQTSAGTSFWIRFPEGFHTHCRLQRFDFGRDGLLYRHDYRASLAGPLVYGAHYCGGYTDVAGVKVATWRNVRPRFRAWVLPISGVSGKLVF